MTHEPAWHPILALSFALAAAPLAADEAGDDTPDTDPPALSRIEVNVLFRSGRAEIPVESRVLVKGSEIETETDRDGRAFLDLPRCDQTVRVVAEPYFDIYRDTEEPCDGSPLVLETPARYGELTALLIGGSAEPLDSLDPFPSGLFAPSVVRSPDVVAALDGIRDAYRSDDYPRLATLAADLSYRLRTQAPSVAQSLSVVAMDSGYRAIGVDPAEPENPLIAFDPQQSAYVMTPLGQDVYRTYAEVIGISPNAAWTYAGIDALNEVRNPETRAQIDDRLTPQLNDALRVAPTGSNPGFDFGVAR